jgi:predicted PurR-regulated permease PerM
MLVHFIHQAIHTLPQIVTTAIPKLTALCASFGIELPFANVYDLRESVIEQAKDNANSITKASGFLTHGFFRIFFAIVIAILAFFSQKEDRYELHAFDALRREFSKRVYLFLLSFERVFGAQIVIAAINTLLTLVFLLLMGLPHVTFLALATFILGTLPFIGNIISNAIIVSVALVISPRQAAYALAYLILIHKLEYFLNAKIVGARTQTSTWQALLAVVLGEVVMGVPGILLAPAVLHYVKQELRTIPTGIRP